MSSSNLWALLLAAVLAPCQHAWGDDEPIPLNRIATGQWVTVKGAWTPDGEFQAEEVEVTLPASEHQLIGTVEAVYEDGFLIMDQRIQVSGKTAWRRDLSLSDIKPGMRLDIEGYYRGALRFSAREVAPRDPGRDRISGRIDRLKQTAEGISLEVTRYSIQVPRDAAAELDGDLVEYLDEEGGEIPLAPFQEFGSLGLEQELARRNNEDVPQSFIINDDLSVGFRLQWLTDEERNYDLREDDPEDRRDDEASLRAEMLYRPEGNFTGYLGVRNRFRWRDDEEDGQERDTSFRVSEAWGFWENVYSGVDVQIGRQDFDDYREWLYDENLDALRVMWTGADLRLELSASTVVADGGEALESTDNLIAYLSNTDDDKHLAAYIIDRRDRREVPDYPFLFGARALGEWIPDNEVWAELAFVRGFTGDVELDGYGFDLGTTWKPDISSPWYFSGGYAFGSGDSDLSDGVDSSFRQSGLQDNSSKLGGVTSFKYYGELLDPELSNIRILSLGVGRRFTKRHSLDLIWHRYRQDEAVSRLRDSNLDRRPNGIDTYLGDEIDLVWGSRWNRSWSMEIVLSTFLPGSAFDLDDDPAHYGKFQLRYRF